MSTNGPFGDFILDLATRLNQAAEKHYNPRCADCGDKIIYESFNGRCGSCHQQLRREEFREWEQQQKVNQ